MGQVADDLGAAALITARGAGLGERCAWDEAITVMDLVVSADGRIRALGGPSMAMLRFAWPASPALLGTAPTTPAAVLA